MDSQSHYVVASGSDRDNRNCLALRAYRITINVVTTVPSALKNRDGSTYYTNNSTLS